jgi:predicted acyltransferase (DUF342 family)
LVGASRWPGDAGRLKHTQLVANGERSVQNRVKILAFLFTQVLTVLDQAGVAGDKTELVSDLVQRLSHKSSIIHKQNS